MESAFEWLNHHTGGLQARRQAELRMQRWPEIIVQPRLWKDLIRKAQRHAIATNKADTFLKQWHFDFVTRAVQVGLDLEVNGLILRGLQADQAPQDTAHGCIPCQMTFRTHAAWAVHAYKCHARIAPERLVIQDSCCRACRRNYHTTARLQRHLKHSKRCVDTLADYGLLGAVRPGIGNTRADQDRPLPLPVMEMEPVPTEIDPEEAPAHARDDLCESSLQRDYNPELLQHLLQALDMWGPTADLSSAMDSCSQSIQTIIEDFSVIYKTVQLAAALCDGDERHMLHRVPLDPFGRRLFQQLMEETTLANCIPCSSVHCTAKQIRGATMQGLHAVRHQPFVWQHVDHIPRPCTRHMLILHLFSGHRRPQDIPSYLEDMQSPAGVHVTLVPIDIIYDPEKCDLSQPSVRARWICYVRTGCILGMIAGPPCETFSRARRLGGIAGVSEGDGGPRVLRSRTTPFGLPMMKADEREHVHLSNVLLLFVHELALELLVWACRFFLKEHPILPDEAEQEDLPSSWDLGSTHVLRAHPAVRSLDFYQGLLGAASPKPTTFLLCGLNQIEQEITACSTCPMPAALQMGKNSSAEYNTAALKAYPPQLCKAIAESVKAHVAAFDDGNTHDLTFEPMDDWVNAILTRTNANYAAVRGADRAGRGT